MGFKKYILAVMFLLNSSLAFSANCQQLLSENGDMMVSKYIGGQLVTMKAQFQVLEKNLHGFKFAEFYIDNKLVNLTRSVVLEMFLQMGYDGVNYIPMKSASLMNKKPLYFLNSNGKLESTYFYATAEIVDIESGRAIIPYFQGCSF